MAIWYPNAQAYTYKNKLAKGLIYVSLILILISCSNKKTNSSTANDSISSIGISKNTNTRPIDNHIAIYTKIDKYINDLSEIASEIKFVKLANEPLLRDFFIGDIEVCDKYIFLQSRSEAIFQYDWDGNFIRQIGSKGQGPGEYITLDPVIQIDAQKQLLYANDLHFSRFLTYNFNGNFKEAKRIGETDHCLTLLDSTTIAVRTTHHERFLPYQTKLLTLQNYNRETVKSFKSHLYPISRNTREHGGPEVNPLWKCKDDFYTLEYGNDTIYQVTKDSLFPSLILTGELSLNKNELFKKEQGNKVYIGGPLLKPNSYVFESGLFLLFRIIAKNGCYFAICNKKTGELYRTGKQKKRYDYEYKKDSNEDYFIDNIVSNMAVDPLFQSNGMAIGMIPATAIIEDKEDILDFISKHPTDEGKKLQKIIENITEEDNSILCFIRFK